MPTWSMPAREELLSKKTRSPGRASVSEATACPDVACWAGGRGGAGGEWAPALPRRRLLGGGPRQADAHVGVDPLGQAGAVQPLGGVGAAPEVGHPQVLLGVGDDAGLRGTRAAGRRVGASQAG